MPDDAQYVIDVLNYRAGDFSQWPQIATRRHAMPIVQKYWPDYYKDSQVWFYQSQNPIDDVDTYQIMSNRAHLANASKSSGAARDVVWRTSFWTSKRAAIRGLKLVCSNAYLTTTGEAAGPNTIFVTCSIEYGGRFFPVYWFGVRERNIPVGTNLVSDVLQINIPPNSQFWVRSNVRTANAGEKFKTGYTARADFGEGYSLTTPLAQVDAVGALTANNIAAMYTPTAVLGTSIEGRPPSVVIIGSSSAFGQGEDFPNIPAPGDRGYLSRMVSNNFGQVVLAAGSETLAQYIAAATIRNNILTLTTPTHVIQQLGSNDIQGGATAATVQSRLQTVWNTLAASGARRVIQCTYTPTSSGTWTTTAGQTSTFNAVRVAVNNFIRTCPAPLAGYIDACAVTESAPNSGLWRVDGGAWTTDGIHTTKHAEIAALLSTTGIIS